MNIEIQTKKEEHLQLLERRSIHNWQGKYYPELTWKNYYRANMGVCVPHSLVFGVCMSFFNSAAILGDGRPTAYRLALTTVGLAITIGNGSRLFGQWGFYEKYVGPQLNTSLPQPTLWQLSPAQVKEHFAELIKSYPKLADDKNYFAEVMNLEQPKMEVYQIKGLGQNEKELLKQNRKQDAARFEQMFVDRYNNDLWQHSFVIAVSYLHDKAGVGADTRHTLEKLVWKSKSLQRCTAFGLLAATPEIIRRAKGKHRNHAALIP